VEEEEERPLPIVKYFFVLKWKIPKVSYDTFLWVLSKIVLRQTVISCSTGVLFAYGSQFFRGH